MEPETSEEETTPKEPETTSVSEIEQLKKEAAEFKDKYFRSLAEAENMRKRLSKEKQEMTSYATQALIAEFLAPLDHMENALRYTEGTSPEVKHWSLGFQMILTQFKDVLSNNGVQSFESKGKHFDPQLHEAVETEEREDVAPGIIIEEFVRGYKMGSKTIRPARVKVSKSAATNDKN